MHRPPAQDSVTPVNNTAPSPGWHGLHGPSLCRSCPAGDRLPDPPRCSRSPARQEEDACWREAVRLRGEHRDSIVMWLAPENCFRAYLRLAGGRYLS